MIDKQFIERLEDTFIHIDDMGLAWRYNKYIEYGGKRATSFYDIAKLVDTDNEVLVNEFFEIVIYREQVMKFHLWKKYQSELFTALKRLGWNEDMVKMNTNGTYYDTLEIVINSFKLKNLQKLANLCKGWNSIFSDKKNFPSYDGKLITSNFIATPFLTEDGNIEIYLTTSANPTVIPTVNQRLRDFCIYFTSKHENTEGFIWDFYFTINGKSPNIYLKSSDLGYLKGVDFNLKLDGMNKISYLSNTKLPNNTIVIAKVSPKNFSL